MQVGAVGEHAAEVLYVGSPAGDPLPAGYRDVVRLEPEPASVELISGGAVRGAGPGQWVEFLANEYVGRWSLARQFPNMEIVFPSPRRVRCRASSSGIRRPRL